MGQEPQGHPGLRRARREDPRPHQEDPRPSRPRHRRDWPRHRHRVRVPGQDDRQRGRQDQAAELGEARLLPGARADPHLELGQGHPRAAPEVPAQGRADEAPRQGPDPLRPRRRLGTAHRRHPEPHQAGQGPRLGRRHPRQARPRRRLALKGCGRDPQQHRERVRCRCRPRRPVPPRGQHDHQGVGRHGRGLGRGRPLGRREGLLLRSRRGLPRSLPARLGGHQGTGRVVRPPGRHRLLPGPLGEDQGLARARQVGRRYPQRS